MSLSALLWSAAWTLPASKYTVWQRRDLHTGREDSLCLCAELRMTAISPGLNNAAIHLSSCLWETEEWQRQINNKKKGGKAEEELVLLIQLWQIDSYISTERRSFGLWTAVRQLTSHCIKTQKPRQYMHGHFRDFKSHMLPWVQFSLHPGYAFILFFLNVL